MISSLLSGIAAKLGGASLAAKAGVGLTMAAASVTGAGAAGVLPDPVQHAVAGVVGNVTPFEFPDGADDRSGFGARVSGDARDDEPGVDGSVIADEARRLGEERRGDAGAPEGAAAEGLDRARQTPTGDHVPATVPGDGSIFDQYRPAEPQSGAPADAPAGGPETTPASQPEETQSGQPEGTPTGQPEEVPVGDPETVPVAPPSGTPAARP